MATKRGIQVVSGSSVIHKFLDDGTVVLGNDVAGFQLGVSGSATFGRASNNVSDVTKVNGVLKIPRYSATVSTDVTILNTLAATPSRDNGYILYLNSEGCVSGTNVGGVVITGATQSHFPQGHRWYFCRNGVWDPDKFI